MNFALSNTGTLRSADVCSYTLHMLRMSLTAEGWGIVLALAAFKRPWACRNLSEHTEEHTFRESDRQTEEKRTFVHWRSLRQYITHTRKEEKVKKTTFFPVVGISSTATISKLI